MPQPMIPTLRVDESLLDLWQQIAQRQGWVVLYFDGDYWLFMPKSEAHQTAIEVLRMIQGN